MGDVATLPRARPAPFAATTFEAFRIPDGITRPRPTAIATDADTLAACVDQAKVRCFHKDKLMIRVTDRAGETVVYFYTIAKGAATWVQDGFRTRRIEPLEAKFLFLMVEAV